MKLALLSTDPVVIQAAGGKRPTFSTVAYHGGPLTLREFPFPVIIDLAGLKAADNVVILRDHNIQRPVGFAESVRILRDRVEASGAFIENQDAEEILKASKAGFPWSVSVGVNPQRLEEVKAGQSVFVNGWQVTGPAFVARDATLREISVVSLGADSKARVAIAAMKGTVMQTFEEWVSSLGLDIATLTADAKAALQKAYDAMQAPTADPVPAAAASATVQATSNQDIQARIDAAVANALALQRVRDRGNNGRPGVAPAVDRGQVIEASLLLQTGVAAKHVEGWFGQRVVNEAMTAGNRNVGLHGLVRACINATGGHVPTGRIDDATLHQALRAHAVIQAGWTPISLSGILGNVLRKSLLASYSETPTSWQRFCRTASATDFKTITRYRLTAGPGESGRLEEVGAGGEIKHGTLKESSETNSLRTYAKMLTITRQDLINDDLGALQDIPKILGRLAAVNLERRVYTLLLANTGSFFASGNSNYLSGGSSALALSALDSALKKMIEQTDPSGEPVLIQPSILLVPPALAATARQILNSQLLTGSTTANTLLPSGNPFQGQLEPVVSPYLSTAIGLTGASDTAWYVLTGPSDFSAFEVCFLNGQQSPTVEDAEADFNVLGVQFRCFHDFGVSQGNYRGGVKSAGV